MLRPLLMLGLAFSAMALGCHREPEMIPLAERTIYRTDRFYDVEALSPEKAIVVDEAVVVKADGTKAKLGRPKVVAERCIGCGVCEHVCPVAHESAIRVYATEAERLE